MVGKKWWQKFWQLAQGKTALRSLIFVAIAESIFFPVPPDMLLIPMGLAKRDRVFFYAGICLAGSILGGIIGYYLGYFFMDTLGQKIIAFYGVEDKYLFLQRLYQQYQVWAVGIAGFTPVPYKLCTLTAGAFKISLLPFVLISILSRGARFYLIAGLLYWKGEQARVFLEKRFNWLLIIGLILGLGLYIVLKLR